MIARHLCLAILLLGTFGFSQEGEIGFRLLRQDDEVWFLKGKEQRTGYERLKWMPLGSEAALSLGGSWRGQFESFKNEQFQNVPDQDNGWILNRYLAKSWLIPSSSLSTGVIASLELITLLFNSR